MLHYAPRLARRCSGKLNDLPIFSDSVELAANYQFANVSTPKHSEKVAFSLIAYAHEHSL